MSAARRRAGGTSHALGVSVGVDVEFDVCLCRCCRIDVRAGAVFWQYDAVDGMEEPTGLRSANNTFTDSNAAAYGMTLPSTFINHMLLL